jgi:hypothetical protein
MKSPRAVTQATRSALFVVATAALSFGAGCAHADKPPLTGCFATTLGGQAHYRVERAGKGYKVLSRDGQHDPWQNDGPPLHVTGPQEMKDIFGNDTHFIIHGIDGYDPDGDVFSLYALIPHSGMMPWAPNAPYLIAGMEGSQPAYRVDCSH